MHSSPSTSDLAGREYDNGALRLITLLGSGAYGSVYSAHDSQPSSESNDDPQPVLRAVKCIEKRDEERLLMEILYHKSVCEHPNVLTLHRTFDDAYIQFIVLDIAPDGDLFNAITQDHLFERNNALLKAGFLQVVDAVEHCHNHGVFHRDLKPENLLCFDQGKRLVLTDFGLATNMLSSKDFGLGSQQYMSPECVGPGRGQDGDAYMHRTSDIWSIGIILINMSTALNPWQIASSSDECFNAYRRYPGWLRMSLPISDESARVVKHILDISPSTRITLKKLRKEAERVQSFYSVDSQEDDLPPIPQYNRIDPPLDPEVSSDVTDANPSSSLLEVHLLDSVASPVPAKVAWADDFVDDDASSVGADASLSSTQKSGPSPSTSLPAATPSIRLVAPQSPAGEPPSLRISSSGSISKHILKLAQTLQNASLLPIPHLRASPPAFEHATWSACTANSSALPTPGEPLLDSGMKESYFPAMPLPKGEDFEGDSSACKIGDEVGMAARVDVHGAAKGSLVHVDLGDVDGSEFIRPL